MDVKLRRTLLASTVATCILAGLPARAEIGSADIGGWSDVWGEDAEASPAPARRQFSASPAFTPAVQPASSRVDAKAPAPSDIGGWGDAWSEEERTPQPVAQNRAPAVPIKPAPATEPSRPQLQTAPVAKASASQGEKEPTAGATGAADKKPSPGKNATGQTGFVPAEDRPINIVADQILYDRDLGIVTATGGVEVVQGNRTLTAETVSYNLKQDIVNASGKVTLLEPDGNVMFAEYFELTGDFKTGVAEEIRMLLVDRSRMRAATGERIAGDRTVFEDAAYTACEPCRDNPDKGPLWETKAKRVTHNQTEKTIEYRDAWIEFAGVPVAYTPYLSHPDPTVKRKSGILIPTLGMSSTLGTNLTIPYFWAIADNQDLTVTPRFLFPSRTFRHPASTKAKTDVKTEEPGTKLFQRMVLAGEHRWVGMEGETKTVGSLTADRYTGRWRGHVDAKGRFDMTEVWRAGYQLQRASDDTYTTLYGYPIVADRPWLTTRPYVEGFGPRNYAMAEGFSFQGTRMGDDPGRSPLVLPHATMQLIGDPDSRGAYWTLDSDFLSYSRDEATDATRISSTVAWHYPFRTSRGELYRLSTSMRADGYHSTDLAGEGTSNRGRVVPQASLSWSYPFAGGGAQYPQVIEPMAMVAASPNGGNPSGIPNEDSIDFELDEMNVLRPNRLPGLDRVEGGLRGGYGLRWSMYPARNGYLSAQVAQGFRARKDSTFAPNSGFEDNLSDYLARVDIAPTANVALLNRVRIDKDTLEVNRNETTFSVGPPMLRLSATYLMLEGTGTEAGLNRRQYVSYAAQSELSRYWYLLASASHDLTQDGGPLGWGVQAVYSDECFAFVTRLNRFYTTDRDLVASYELSLNIVFKTLGDLPFNVF